MKKGKTFGIAGSICDAKEFHGHCTVEDVDKLQHKLVFNPNVEPTNNRALMPSVIFRKVYAGSGSERGAEIYTKLFSIYYTPKLGRKNFINDTP